MDTFAFPLHCGSLSDGLLLDTLRNCGPQTLEELAFSLTNAGWVEVFAAVDRLSRVGTVSLHPIRRSEYQVSLARVVT